MEHGSSGIVLTAIVTTLSAFIGALISHFLIQRRSMDLAIYKQRGEIYKPLWEKTALFARWPRRTDVAYSQLRPFSEDLRKWYYDGGGTYLSESARAAYGKLQEALNADSLIAKIKTNPSQMVDCDSRDYTLLMKLGSNLRSELTRDLLSRKRILFFTR